MTPWVKRLIIANVLVYFLEQTSAWNFIATYLMLVPQEVWRHPWTVVTYMFLHDRSGFTHILFNMLGLYFFGPRVEERIGGNRFLALYFISGLTGAAFSFLFAYNSAVIGASGAVFGVMLAFARFWPDVQILLFFFLPVPAGIAVALMAAMTLWSGINGLGGGVADFCHLGGFVGAIFYLLYLDRRAGTKKFRSHVVTSVPNDTLANWKKVDPRSVHEVNRDEVNRILDKINAKGIGSLSVEEKLFLSNFVPADDRKPPVS
ncbi:MAG TPA: rhomboid family intramembrane serine protease [Gemmatimonadaceae bacterium]